MSVGEGSKQSFKSATRSVVMYPRWRLLYEVKTEREQGSVVWDEMLFPKLSEAVKNESISLKMPHRYWYISYIHHRFKHGAMDIDGL